MLFIKLVFTIRKTENGNYEYCKLIKKTDGLAVASLAVASLTSAFSNYFILLYYSFPTMTINTREQLIQLGQRRYLQASFVI